MAATKLETSFNFSVAKVLAILLVVAGHFFDGTLLWIPVTVGLFVFAFSSAYFTTKKYGDNFEQSSFWSNKIGRLAIPFWVTQGFLLLLFLATGRDGIWTWQTLVHWLGQSGWLNWFVIPNASPFGAGLWFFTLLLVFYLLYPLIARWNATPKKANMLLPVALFMALILSHEVKVGHALWLTAFAFWFGVYAARNPLGGSARLWLIAGAVSMFIMLAANFLGVKFLNTLLLFCMSISAVLWIEKAVLPRIYFSWAMLLSPVLLEIYLIHTYLFVKADIPIAARFVVSLALIIASAIVMSRISNRLTVKVLKQN